MARSRTASLIVTLQDKATKKLERLELRIQSLAKTAAKRAPLALAAAAAGISYFTKQAIDATLEIQKNAAAAQLSTDTYQALEGTLQAAGISTRNLTTAMRTLTQRAADAARGEGGALKLFDQLGVSATDAAGRVKDTETILFEVSDALASMSSEAQKAGIGSQLMGRAFSETRTIFAQGSDAIREHIDAAKSAGQVLDEELVKRGAAAASALDNVGQAATASARELVLQLAPAINEVADAINRAFSRAALERVFEQNKTDILGLKSAFQQMEEAAKLGGDAALEAINAASSSAGGQASSAAENLREQVDQSAEAQRRLVDLADAVNDGRISAIRANELAGQYLESVKAAQDELPEGISFARVALSEVSGEIARFQLSIEDAVKKAQEVKDRLQSEAAAAIDLTADRRVNDLRLKLIKSSFMAEHELRLDQLNYQVWHHQTAIADLDSYIAREGLSEEQRLKLMVERFNKIKELKEAEQELALVTQEVTTGAIRNSLTIFRGLSNRREADNRKDFNRQKRNNIAVAKIETILAAQEQFTANAHYPAPIPQLAAAAAYFSGMQRVAAIQATSFAGGSAGGGSPGAGGGAGITGQGAGTAIPESQPQQIDFSQMPRSTMIIDIGTGSVFTRDQVLQVFETMRDEVAKDGGGLIDLILRGG